MEQLSRESIRHYQSSKKVSLLLLIKKVNFSFLISNSKKGAFNVFLIESNIKMLTFTGREQCAIESAANENPDAKVYILAMKAQFQNNELFIRYPNLYHIKFKPADLFANTPLEEWWTTGAVNKSNIATIHISDAARLAVVYKFGGFYSDLDTIAVRRWNNLLRFSAVGYLRENLAPKVFDSMGSGVLLFKAEHPFLKMAMIEFARKYDHTGNFK